jgi:hypothetical protein
LANISSTCPCFSLLERWCQTCLLLPIKRLEHIFLEHVCAPTNVVTFSEGATMAGDPWMAWLVICALSGLQSCSETKEGLVLNELILLASFFGYTAHIIVASYLFWFISLAFFRWLYDAGSVPAKRWQDLFAFSAVQHLPFSWVAV